MRFSHKRDTEPGINQRMLHLDRIYPPSSVRPPPSAKTFFIEWTAFETDDDEVNALFGKKKFAHLERSQEARVVAWKKLNRLVRVRMAFRYYAYCWSYDRVSVFHFTRPAVLVHVRLPIFFLFPCCYRRLRVS